jgi:hypothetical protein
MDKIMKTLFILLTWCCLAVRVLAQETRPTIRILPGDVVQTSIQQYRTGPYTNKFTVGWTYTDAGARKVLAFREAHEGQTTRRAIGAFESPPGKEEFDPNYAQWKEGWLKYRTTKTVNLTEQDAKKIVVGLKGN